MYIVIGAFILYQLDAGQIWWNAYGVLLLLNFTTAFMQGYYQRND